MGLFTNDVDLNELIFLERELQDDGSFSEYIISFANTLPIFFRVPTLVALVWILWGVNVYIFNVHNIPYADLMKLKSTPTSIMLKPREIIRSGIAILTIILSVFFMSNALYMPLNMELVLQSFFYFMAIMLFIMPFNYLYRPGREHLLTNIYRVFAPLSSGVLFVEVLLGDVMTSLAKVFADAGVTMCIFFTYYVEYSDSVPEISSVTTSGKQNDGLKIVGNNLDIIDAIMTNFHSCTGSWIRPILTSVPFLLRFRQCAVQFLVTKDKKNLLNCLKYLSSLPVIWISAFSQHYPRYASADIQTAWMLAVTFNSCYSFMWDVTMDWGLLINNARFPMLRDILVYDTRACQVCRDESSPVACKRLSPGIYYTAIALDFFLRVLWSFKLSVHFQLSREGFTFFLEVCEVFRRFLWLFFRVEHEYISVYDPDDDTDEEMERAGVDDESGIQLVPHENRYTPTASKLTKRGD